MQTRIIKTVLLILIIFSSLNAQKFLSLAGIEDQDGNTILFFRFGASESPEDNIYCDVFSYEILSGSTNKIMDAYVTITPWFDRAFKTIQDFEFRNDYSSGFINIGIISPGTWYEYYIAYNDTLVFEIEHNNVLPRPFIEISNINPSLVFGSDQTSVYRSYDGGYTFLEDSIINFPLISVSDIDDNIFFGINNANNLIKSENQGITFEVVDTNEVIIDSYFMFLYDVNKINHYRANKTLNKYALYVSNNKGSVSSWSMTYQSINPLFISIDPQLSSLIFLADGQQIYSSQNSGYNFFLYSELESDILGIYKKPSSDILYAISENYIYEINSDTVIIIADKTIVDVDNLPIFKPNSIVLLQNYPNPFNPSTKIKFTIPSATLRQAQSDILVTLKVYDVLGNEVATLVNEEKPAGEYEVKFTVGQDSSPDIASGIYFFQLKAGSFVKTKKMLLLK